MIENIKNLKQRLTKYNIQCSIIPGQYLSDLKLELDQRLASGSLDSVFYHERLTSFSYDIPADFPDAKSLVITATPQPKIKVEFCLNGKHFFAVVPPTYSYETDAVAQQVLSRLLASEGYRIQKAVVPEKMLAVRSGLAGYGRNNVTYVEPFGSFVRLKSFWTDLPVDSHCWQEFRVMERCHNCSACVKKCPTQAVSPDRFIIRAERCLTFLNEKSDPFPEWLKPEWHNCLIGCMICQEVCPMNKNIKDWVVEGEKFAERETLKILNGEPGDSLPSATQDKLKRLYLFDDYHLLHRNLMVLVNNKTNRSDDF